MISLMLLINGCEKEGDSGNNAEASAIAWDAYLCKYMNVMK